MARAPSRTLILICLSTSSASYHQPIKSNRPLSSLLIYVYYYHHYRRIIIIGTPNFPLPRVIWSPQINHCFSDMPFSLSFFFFFGAPPIDCACSYLTVRSKLTGLTAPGKTEEDWDFMIPFCKGMEGARSCWDG